MNRHVKYKCDSFAFRRRALFECIDALDFTYETACDGLVVNGTQDLNQIRRVIFRIDDKYYKFGNSGLIEFNRRITVDEVLAHGNTVEELLNADCTVFIGKMIYPVVALEAGVEDPIKPKIKIAAKVKNHSDVYTKYGYSPIYKLTDNAKIANVKSITNTINNGIATVTCRLKKITGWTDWIYLDAARYQTASAIQFRVQYILSAIDGSDVAEVDNVQCRFVTNGYLATGDFSQLVTNYVDFDADLKTCYVKVDCTGECRAFVNFSDAPIKRENLNVTHYLIADGIVDKGVAPDTIKINTDNPALKLTGQQPDFYFNTDDSSITVDGNVTASWTANYRAENWQEMTNDGDRFTYIGNGKISAVKFVYTGTINRFIAGWKV